MEIEQPDLAEKLDVPLWLVTVVSPSALAAAAAQSPDIGGGNETGYVRSLARRLGKTRDLDLEYDVLHSEHPDRAIVDFVGDDGTAVMSTHGRSGLSRLFAGSITAGVVAHSHRAVVVFRPHGQV